MGMLHKTMIDRRYLPAGITDENMENKPATNDAQADETTRRLQSLTAQQMRVLDMLGAGLFNKQIAHELQIAETTVKAHVSAILHKLKVASRTQAVVLASRVKIP